MKSFKLYLKEGGTNTQLIWLGALMIIIAIVIAAVSLYNYFQIPQELSEDFSVSPQALIIKELYLSAGIGVIGIILLLAGAFAAKDTDSNKKEKENKK